MDVKGIITDRGKLDLKWRDYCEILTPDLDGITFHLLNLIAKNCSEVTDLTSS